MHEIEQPMGRQPSKPLATYSSASENCPDAPATAGKPIQYLIWPEEHPAHSAILENDHVKGSVRHHTRVQINGIID